MANVKQLLYDVSIDFDIITVTESWLDKQDINCANLEGYQVTHTVRDAEKGGGCSIFVNALIKFKIINNLCFNIDDQIECACVELDMGKEKNVIVCCVYRAPGSSLEVFNEKFHELLIDLNSRNKSVYICGDFNIDLLHYENHRSTQEFVDNIFSTGFVPLITKPSRVTEHSATLIDNILTNA